MITRGPFSLEIVDHKGKGFPLWNKDGFNYFKLPDGVKYQIKLSNDSGLRAQISLSLDSTAVKATFQMDSGRPLVLNTLTTHGAMFTFREETSRQALAQDARIGARDNGLVRVSFVPERESSLFYGPSVYAESLPSPSGLSYRSVSGLTGSAPRSPPRRVQLQSISGSPRLGRSSMMSTPESLDLAASGVTTYEGQSKQRFITVPKMDLDWSQSKEIVVRLVVDPAGSYGADELTWQGGIVPPRLD